MKAAVVERYGSPEQVKIVELPIPIVGPREVLVRVEAVAVTSGDARMRSGRFPKGFGVPARLAIGVRGPRQKVLGTAFSGVIEQVGAQVTGFNPGDEVTGMNGARMGAHAQYATIRPRAMALKPEKVSHSDAAGTVFGGTTALHFLRDRVAKGSRLLVNGASGAVGTSAVQVAVLLGADVTAVTSVRNQDLVTQLGATHVIDYETSPIHSLSETFDVVFDTVGNIDRRNGLHLVGEQGVVILAAANLADTIRAGGRVLAGSATERAEDIAHLLQLLGERKLDPVTEVLGGLDAIVEAYRRVDSGRKVGNLVVQPWA
jgi:NADPH:quinone reductase-like Zn-dependent oxidoreductase